MKTKILLIAILMVSTTCVFSQIINVPNDQPTIQAGINAASNGDTVLVEDDTYFENIQFKGKAITVASRFIIDEDESHIDNTIIDGSSATNPDSASTVMFINFEDTTSILYGFTIQGGSGLVNTTWGLKYGGGIACWESGPKIMHNKIKDNMISDPSFDCGGVGIGSWSETGNWWMVIDNNIISDNMCATNAELAFGGGIYVTTNAIIRNNTVEDNSCYNAGTQADGGGIEVQQPMGVTIIASIYNNIINNNELECNRCEGAGIMIYSAEVQVLNNTISNNYNTAEGFSLGAGIMCRYPLNKIIISKNTISNNSGSLGDNVNVGSGICILEAYDIEFIIDANIISNNIAKHGGGFYERSSYNVLFTNNIFKENSANLGAAVGIYHPEDKSYLSNPEAKSYRPKFINNNFIVNSAVEKGGAFRISGPINLPITFNNIFWGNTAPTGPDIHNSSAEDLIISYSNIYTGDVYGNWNGEGNINVDPEIIDDSCHIAPSSQCIEAGVKSLEINSITYNCPDFDIDGQMRPLNGTVDIGVDEVLITRIIPRFDKTESLVSLDIYPNPLLANSLIEFSIPLKGHVSITLYDNMGKHLETILSQEFSQGTHKIKWNSSNLNEGVYFCYLKTSFGSQTPIAIGKKIIKL